MAFNGFSGTRARIWVNGVEVEGVSGIDIGGLIAGIVRDARPDSPVLGEIRADQIRAGVHAFAQDPNEQARLCDECGMWPEHHNHPRFGRGDPCVCSECMPNADWLPDDSHMVPTSNDFWD